MANRKFKILVCPDKFKGSLTATEAAQAIQKGFSQAMPSAEIVLLPIADGGEGTAEVIHSSLGGEWIETAAHDPPGREITARYLLLHETPAAFIDMSAASGMWRLAKHERDPLKASTRGTGELMLDAIRRGAKRLILCLGGSATNDGGAGMAAALGYRFLTSDGEAIEPIPANLLALTAIRAPEIRIPEVVAACDVRNPLLGPSGATAVFGPQKGVNSTSAPLIERALENLADVASHDLGCDFRNEPGAGAAGGLGFGLMTFCRARFRPGFELVAECVGLETAVASADLVITGEGSLDLQTLEGKAPAGVAALARKSGKRVIVFAGVVSDHEKIRELFDGVYPLADSSASIDHSMRNAANLLEQSASRVATLLQLNPL